MNLIAELRRIAENLSTTDYGVVSEAADRIAQLEAALREVNRHLSGHPHFVTEDGLLNNIIAPAWKAVRDALATSETAVEPWIDDGAGGLVNLGRALAKQINDAVEGDIKNASEINRQCSALNRGVK